MINKSYTAVYTPYKVNKRTLKVCLQPLWRNWQAKLYNLEKKRKIRAMTPFKVIEVGINWKPVCDFLLVI